MAQNKWIPQEFIQNSFSPMVAVIASPAVEQSCQKNNLSFPELLQPFCKLHSEAHLRDPSGGSSTVKNLRITVTDVEHRPPHPTLARKLLNASVICGSEPNSTSVTINGHDLQFPSTSPWFEAWRETFLRVQFPSDHEFTKHFIACLLIVSACGDENHIETFDEMSRRLSQLQTVSPNKLPKWISHNILQYYVLLHDNNLSTDRDRSEKLFDTMKLRYGQDNCFLLTINSRTDTSTDEAIQNDPWIQYLNRASNWSDYGETGSVTPTDSMSASFTSYVNTSERGPVELSSPTFNTKSPCIEVGQEANEPPPVPVTVTLHPLSPDIEIQSSFYAGTPGKSSSSLNAFENDLPYPENVNEKHGILMTNGDIQQLKKLVQDFIVRSLLPHVEKEIMRLSDLISNKKGVSRSLFSATKRWFGSNKPGTAGYIPQNTLVYAYDSPELQLRRLGDLYFMFGHYTMAFQAYHSVKRDFNADQAWLYYAGALEMAALSAFMAGEVTRKTCDYMEESIVHYLNSCRMPQFATRATLLSTESLKGIQQYGEAAKQYIRMTSEDSDLRSALLLEQAAYCFLKCERPSMVRKYAFHIVLAGHRFSKAGQKKHSLRCYKQAYQVYKNKEWSLAEDHIHFTIGRQANTLKLTDEALIAFSKLLSTSSQQTAQQQEIFLREFLSIHSQLNKTKDNSIETPILPVPIVEDNLTKVLLSPLPPVTTPGKVIASSCTFSTDLDETIAPKWIKLEEMLVQEAQGSLPMIFRPTVPLYSHKSNNSIKPIGVVAETVHVSIMIWNPLKIAITLCDLQLLWSFKQAETGKEITNEVQTHEPHKCIHTFQLKSIILQPNHKQEIALSVTPLAVGELYIKGIMYNLTSVELSGLPDALFVVGKQLIQLKGPRLKGKEKIQQIDKRLSINVIQTAPCLQVSFSEIPSDILCGEVRAITVDLINHGRCSLCNIYIASSKPWLISFGKIKHPIVRATDTNYNDENQTVTDSDLRKRHVTPLKFPNNYNDILKPGQGYSFTVWVRAPHRKGKFNLDLLIYYENAQQKSPTSYRLLRHSWQLNAMEHFRDTVDILKGGEGLPKELLSIAIQIKNANFTHFPLLSEATLLQISMICPRWTINPVAAIPKDVKLSMKETLDFVLHATREQIKDKSYLSTVKFCSHKNLTNVQQSAYQDFICRSELHLSDIFEGDFDYSSNRSYEGIIVLLWHADMPDGFGGRRTAFGQHYMLLPAVPFLIEKEEVQRSQMELMKQFSFSSDHARKNLSERKELAALEIRQKYVTFNMKFESIVKHNFKKHNICIVPIILYIYSVTNVTIIVKVNTIDPSNYSIPGHYVGSSICINPSTQFRWMGTSKYKIKLEPRATRSLSLKAAFLSGGAYDLSSRIELYCCKDDDSIIDFTQQTWKHLSVIIIENESDKA